MDNDALTESQQQQLLQVMEVCNLDTQAAMTLLKRCNFDLEVQQIAIQNAIQTHFNPGAARSAVTNLHVPAINEPLFEPPNEAPINYMGLDQGDEDQDEMYIRYRNYKNSGMNFQQKYGVNKGITQRIKGLLPSFLRSENPGGEAFINRLNDTYGNVNKLKFNKGTFLDNIQQITKERFPLLIFFLNFQETTKQIVNRIITDEALISHMNTRYRLLGLDTRYYEFQPALAKFINRTSDIPCIAMFRIDICDQIHLMNKVQIQPTMNLMQMRSKFDVSKSMCIRAQMNEAVYEKKYYGMVTGTFVRRQMTFDQKLKLNEERRLKKQQQAEFMISNQLHQEKKKQEKIQVNKEKQLSQKAEVVAKRRKELRDTLPEYTSGVNFKLRLPSGSSVIKVVDPKQLVEYLFRFVESLEEAGFEDEVDRKFEISRPYDRLILGLNREKTIGELFGEEGSENLMVNEK